MELRPFVAADFADYRAWFADPELARELGPMDEAWLACTLSGQHVPGQDHPRVITYAVVEADRLVAVAGVVVPPPDDPRRDLAISELAVRPALRRTGIGAKALKLVLGRHPLPTGGRWTAFVSRANTAATRFFERQGWVADAAAGADDDMRLFVGPARSEGAMPATVTTRRLNPEDGPAIRQLYAETTLVINGRDYTRQQVERWVGFADEASWFTDMLAHRTFVAESAGVIVGFAEFIPPAEVGHVYVHSGWQRRGVGRALMRRVIDEARAHGAKQLSANVSVSALTFFQSHGFAITRTHRRMVCGSEAVQHEMERRLG